MSFASTGRAVAACVRRRSRHSARRARKARSRCCASGISRNVRQLDRRDQRESASNQKDAAAVAGSGNESLVMRQPVFARVADYQRCRRADGFARIAPAAGSTRILRVAMPPVDGSTSTAHPDVADRRRARGLASDREPGRSVRCRALDDSVLRDNASRTREPLVAMRLHRRGSTGRDTIP